MNEDGGGDGGGGDGSRRWWRRKGGSREREMYVHSAMIQVPRQVRVCREEEREDKWEEKEKEG